MQYFGGKQRISKDLALILNNELKPNQTFVDAFCGSCNIITKIDNDRLRIANDKHQALIAFWKHLSIHGLECLPVKITKEDYHNIKINGPLWLQGFVGFAMSFSGKWWGGFTGEVSKNGQDYLKCGINSVEKKLAGLSNVIFGNFDILNLELPDNCLIYCDIPYKGTTAYCKKETGDFNHTLFYQWCETMKERGHDIFVSEYLYNVNHLNVIWQKESGQTNAACFGSAKKTVEALVRL